VTGQKPFAVGVIELKVEPSSACSTFKPLGKCGPQNNQISTLETSTTCAMEVRTPRASNECDDLQLIVLAE